MLCHQRAAQASSDRHLPANMSLVYETASSCIKNQYRLRGSLGKQVIVAENLCKHNVESLPLSTGRVT